jgi:acyl carrier protein
VESVADVIRTALVEKYGVFGDDMGADVTFDDLEVDSLVLVELSVALERRFGVKLPDGVLTPELSLGEAAELVEAKRVAV